MAMVWDPIKLALSALHFPSNLLRFFCYGIFVKSSGPSCSKLTMSLVNDSLKF